MSFDVPLWVLIWLLRSKLQIENPVGDNEVEGNQAFLAAYAMKSKQSVRHSQAFRLLRMVAEWTITAALRSSVLGPDLRCDRRIRMSKDRATEMGPIVSLPVGFL